MRKKEFMIVAIVCACILVLPILATVLIFSQETPTVEPFPIKVTEEATEAEALSETVAEPAQEAEPPTTEPARATEAAEGTEPKTAPKTSDNETLSTSPVIEAPMVTTPQPEDPTEEAKKNDFIVDFDDLLNGAN